MLRGTKEVIQEKTFRGFQFLFGVAVLIYSILILVSDLQGKTFSFSSPFVLEILVLLLGLFFIQDGLFARKKHLVSFLVGFFLSLLGLFPILVDAGLLDFLPVHVELIVSPLLLGLLLFFSSAYFLVDRCSHMFEK
ncbi:MAG TPA: hypothetical protein VJJ79_01620 [Candidatus Nanoarchaeia archaeon]|nr:hypothetical protein [Candidatus Nanoarchaeia archaeon]